MVEIQLLGHILSMTSSNNVLYFLINYFIQGNVSLKTDVKHMCLGQSMDSKNTTFKRAFPSG